jgi:hypothetical protein
MEMVVHGLAVVGFFSLLGFVLVIVCLTRSEEQAKEVLWGYCWAIWIVAGFVLGTLLIALAYAADFNLGKFLYSLF